MLTYNGTLDTNTNNFTNQTNFFQKWIIYFLQELKIVFFLFDFNRIFRNLFNIWGGALLGVVK